MAIAAAQLESSLQGRDPGVFFLTFTYSFIRPLRCGSCCPLCEFCFRPRSGGFITRGLETFFGILDLASSFFELELDSFIAIPFDN